MINEGISKHYLSGEVQCFASNIYIFFHFSKRWPYFHMGMLKSKSVFWKISSKCSKIILDYRSSKGNSCKHLLKLVESNATPKSGLESVLKITFSWLVVYNVNCFPAYMLPSMYIVYFPLSVAYKLSTISSWWQSQCWS